VSVEFEAGVPIALDGNRMGLVELLEAAAAIGERHGVGIVDHIEDRIVGLKVRDIYEVPAAEVILNAHKELEKLVFTGRQSRFKAAIDSAWADLCYEGLWYEPLRADLDAFLASASELVEGEVTVRLYKGSAVVRARTSPNALYDKNMATFDADPTFSQNASPGFIELFSLQSRMAHQIRQARGDA
jgi:argininosuccinate synthase